MNRDEIIRMAREAGLQPYYDAQGSAIARFAELVEFAAKEEMLIAGNDQWLEAARASEREACARIAEDPRSGLSAWRTRERIAEAIRARGSQ